VSGRLRVLVADDHVPTRAGVRLALEQGDMLVCAEAATAQAAVSAALRERPDVCLLDIHMPGSGIKAAGEISARLPETPVVMLTVSSADEDIFDSLRAGARGYLLKDMDPARLPAAVRGVLAGEAALPRPLATRLINEFRARGRRLRLALPDGRAVELTPREWDVFELLCENHGTAEIADRLFLSPVTVRRHTSTIVRKLDVSSRDEAVRLARRSAS
jgi:DNA-binding NarL/FixJ family response regulator